MRLMGMKVAFVLFALLISTTSWAQTFTTGQRTTLKTAVLASQDTLDLYTAGDLSGLAALLNTPSSPAFIVWKTNVPIGTVGVTFNATELAGLSSLNTTRLTNLALWMPTGVNPSITSVRSFFDDIFSGAGGTNTRAALLALWKRTATRLERIFATGTGSDAVPGLLVIEAATVHPTTGVVTGTLSSAALTGIQTW